MKRKVAVSKKGFAMCSGCHSFTKVAPELDDTVCSFCGSQVTRSSERPVSFGLSRVLKAGRSGLLAASLLGMGGLSACDSTTTPPSDVADVVNDTVFVAPYGIPPDTEVTPDTGNDVSDAGPDTVGADTTDPVDAPILPPYGIPPDAGN